MRKGYKAFAEGDLDAIRELFADDIVWHVGGRNKLSGDYKGIDEVFGFFGKLMEVGQNLKQEIHDVIANDEHAVVLVTTSMEVNGAPLKDNAVHVFHVQDGKATEFWGHTWNSYEFDEALPA
jgi:ketosteroid isomerase-like protein